MAAHQEGLNSVSEYPSHAVLCLWYSSSQALDIAATWTISQQRGHIHVQEMNIKHLNTALITTELPGRDTRVDAKITIYMTICNKVYKTEVRRRSHCSTSAHDSPATIYLNNNELFLVSANFSCLLLEINFGLNI
jgi:hypothetical protein